MPTSRIAHGVRLLVEAAATVSAQEIRMQPVQGISAAGRYVIEGAAISAVGTARLALGQIVPVVYESGRPLVIFALEWQRGRGEVGQEQALGVVEELLLLRAASPDPGSLWFRSESQILKLDVVAVVAAKKEANLTLGLGNITALKWGEDQNSFVLQGTIPVSDPPGADDGKTEFFLFSLSRTRAGETVGGVTFLRRERPWSRSDITLGTVAATYREQITTRSVLPKIKMAVETAPGPPPTYAPPTYEGTDVEDNVYDSTVVVDYSSSTSYNLTTHPIPTFTVAAAAIPYFIKQENLTFISAANPLNYVSGPLLSYTATSVTIYPVFVSGSGTHSDWNKAPTLPATQTITLTMLGASVADFYLTSARELVVLASAADFGVAAYQGGTRWNLWLVNLTTKAVLWSSDKRKVKTTDPVPSWGRVRTTPSIANVRARTVPLNFPHFPPENSSTWKYFKVFNPTTSAYDYRAPSDSFYGDAPYTGPPGVEGAATVSDVSGALTVHALLDGLALPFLGVDFTTASPQVTATAAGAPDFSYLVGALPPGPGGEAVFRLTTNTIYPATAPIAEYLPMEIKCFSPGTATIPALLFVGILKMGPDLTFFGKGAGVATQRWGVFVIDRANALLATLTPGFDPTSAATILATRYKLVESDAVNFDSVDVQLLSASRRHVLWARYREATTEIYLSSIPTQTTRLLATDATGQIQFLLSEALQALPPDMLYEVQSLLRSIAGTKRTTDQRFGVGWDWSTGALDAALTLEPVTLDAAGELLLTATNPQEDQALAGAGTLVPLGAAATKIVKARSLHGLQIVNSQERLGPAGRYRQEGT